MNIFQLNKILLEYDALSDITDIKGQDGITAGGKSFAQIATGNASPYIVKGKGDKKPSANELKYSALAKLIADMKSNAIKGNKLVLGAAKTQLEKMLSSRTPKTDQNGDIVLPFGKDVRVSKTGNNYFIRLKSVADKENTQTQDITQQPTQNV